MGTGVERPCAMIFHPALPITTVSLAATTYCMTVAFDTLKIESVFSTLRIIGGTFVHFTLYKVIVQSTAEI